MAGGNVAIYAVRAELFDKSHVFDIPGKRRLGAADPTQRKRFEQLVLRFDLLL